MTIGQEEKYCQSGTEEVDDGHWELLVSSLAPVRCDGAHP